MTGQKPNTMIDPVCGMSVVVEGAEADGRTAQHEGKTFVFCRDGCRRAFLQDPATYHEQAAQLAENGAGAAGETSGRATTEGSASPVIDEGMRRWYESCSCCLSDAYPEVKAQLDAERTSGSDHPGTGVTEVAQAG